MDRTKQGDNNTIFNGRATGNVNKAKHLQRYAYAMETSNTEKRA